jgi:molybdopterin-containing oxidoreductase family membrane subunit
MLATGLIVDYGYIMETFLAWYGGDVYERHMVWNRMHGPYAPFYWALVLLNIGLLQVVWLKKVRQSPKLLFLVSFILLIAMWLERFVIVVISLAQDFDVSSWGIYTPTRWDYAVLLGTVGFFILLFLLFLRVLPFIPIFEMKHLLPASHPHVEVEA